MHKLYEWLIEKTASRIDSNTTLLDIGAYHGDFTSTLISKNKFIKARLFEPNPDHYTYLKNKFNSANNIFLSPYALGNSIGTQQFNCSQDDATGSLLPYHHKYHHPNAGKIVNSFSVEVRKLDDLYIEHFSNEKIGLVKIDTQGFDLEVLKGAERLIQEQHPWLVIELNFLPFYASQASINEIFNWLMHRGYSLGALFNDHYSKDQWLAFADGVFIPTNLVDTVMEPFYPRLVNDELEKHNKYLQAVCDERLKLIESLHSEAEKRLTIINHLKRDQMPHTGKCTKSWVSKLLSRS